jgi:GAF domain-containing protein
MQDIYKKLADFGRELLEKRTVAEGLPLIAKYAKDVIGAQRVSIFLYHDNTDELWTSFADGVDKIIVPADKGIVGETLKAQKTIVVNDVNKDPNFFAEIDRQTGYRTYNIMAAPIYNSLQEVVGVLELLNKEGGFTQKDAKLIRLFAHSISSFIELMLLNEEVK